MPLLNRKRVPLTPNIPYDPKRKRKEVWYLRFTNEVFTSYESYINKLTLYHQSIWECEATGRQNLTYEQALESEKTEHDRAEYKFCQALRISILNRIKFQTVRLEALVNDVYSYFKNTHVVDEIVKCRLNDYDYFARIVEILPRPPHEYQRPIPWSINQNHESPSISNSESEDEANVPRQPNGRLRFPDAFLHPTPQSPSHSENDSNPDPSSDTESFTDLYQYKVQLIDEAGHPLENCTRIVEGSEIKREKYIYNRQNVQSFIRECSYRDNYMNAPWLIKPAIASTYNIDTRLPDHLQEAQDRAFAKTSKKRKMMIQSKTPDEREAEKKARKEESLLQKAKLKEERDKLREERKKQSAVKYPLEDLDLPIYRKDPNLNWALIDMSPQKFDSTDAIIPYPSGGRTERPIPHYDSPIPPELFDSFLSIWTFLTVFAEPLKLSAYSVDEFERALFHTTHQPKATVLVEYNACLLNVIINERKEDTTNEIINGDIMETYLESLEENIKEEEEEEIEIDGEKKIGSKLKNHDMSSVLPKVERGWRDKEHLKLSQKWDNKELRANYDRRGWETTLIGCLNDIATPELIPDLDDLLRHLVPRFGSTAADREKQYPTLSLKQKLDIMNFLVDVVNESNLIKNYMDYCQEQLSEFRKQKVELNKESKSLSFRRIEMDKRDKAEKSEETSDDSDSDETNSDDSDNESNEDSDIESDSSERRIAGRERRHQSRQEKLKQKQREREEMENQRKKMYAEQREVAKAKNQEQRVKASERRRLDEEERVLKKKEEHLEKSMRRYMTLRIRPLGKDRFNNRYIYLDNVGVSNTYGSGRLYINSPTDGDIQMMMERDHDMELPDQPWGHGGGRWFIKKLMHAQGLFEESAWLENRMDELDSENPTEYKGWWKYYSDPDEIQQLMSWLNPKGCREHKLKSELLKQQSNIVESMKKRAHALTKTEAITKRPTRAKSATNSDTWDKSKSN